MRGSGVYGSVAASADAQYGVQMKKFRHVSVWSKCCSSCRFAAAVADEETYARVVFCRCCRSGRVAVVSVQTDHASCSDPDVHMVWRGASLADDQDAEHGALVLEMQCAGVLEDAAGSRAGGWTGCIAGAAPTLAEWQ